MRALLVAGLLATGLCGQVINSQSRIVRTDANGNVKIGTRIPTLYTIGGTLPAAAAGNLGQVKTVSNAADYSDCTVGGGTTVHECYSTGAAWVAFGGTGALPAGVTSDGANGLTVMGNVQAATFSSPAPGDGSAGYSELVEGTAPTAPDAGKQRVYIDSADHLLKRKNSASAVTTISGTVASGAKALATAEIASGACTAAQTDTATGAATTDVVMFTPNADITAVTGYAPVTTGGLAIYPYATANTVNFKVCNPTTSAITPGAVTLNWRVVR